MRVLDNIVMGLMQAYLHEQFGPGWSVLVHEHPNDDRGVVQIRIRHGELGDGVAANANMLIPHLKFMIEGKTIQEQIFESIGDDWQPHVYLNTKGMNTCQHVYDEIIENLEQFSWTEKNNPE